MVSSQLKLHRYHTGRESRVVTALTLLKTHLFRCAYILMLLRDKITSLHAIKLIKQRLNYVLLTSYQGYVSAALVLGGVDVTGPHLHTVSGLVLESL